MLVARHSIQQCGSTLKHASRGSGISSRESVVPRKTFEGNIRAAEANTRRALIPMTAVEYSVVNAVSTKVIIFLGSILLAATSSSRTGGTNF